MPGSSKNTILVAEDSDDDFLLFSWALEKSGVNVRVDLVKDGEEAIQYLSTKSAPCVILLDLKLPKCDGFEVLDWLRTHDEIPSRIGILSSSNRTLDKKRAYALGASFYFTKPLSIQDYAPLIGRLRELCAA
jgi:two-component system response regulator